MIEGNKTAGYMIVQEACTMFSGHKLSEEEFIDTLDWLQNLVEECEVEYENIFSEGKSSDEHMRAKLLVKEGIKIYKKAITELEIYTDELDKEHMKNGLNMAVRGAETLLKAKELIKDKEKHIDILNKIYKNQLLGTALERESPAKAESGFTEEVELKEKLEKSKKKSEIISLVPLFSVLGEKQIEKLDKRIKLSKYKKNDILFYEGDISDKLYIVKSGEIAIYKENKGIKDLAILNKGDLLGEMGIIMNAPRSLSARASSDISEVYVISRGDFLYMLNKYPELSLNLCKILCQRIKERSDSIIASPSEYID